MSWLAAASVVGSLYSANQAKKESARNRAFQLDASNTAYQRAMADMKKAGLNPILAGRYGPASTPSGSVAQMPDIGKSFTSGMSTAYQGQQTQANVGKIRFEVNKLVADTGVSLAQQSNIVQLTKKAIEETKSSSLRNAINSVLTEFKTDNPNVTIAQEFGVDAGKLVDIIGKVVGKTKGK